MYLYAYMYVYDIVVEENILEKKFVGFIILKQNISYQEKKSIEI